MKIQASGPSLIEFIVKVLFVSLISLIEVYILTALLGTPAGWDVALLVFMNWSAATVTVR